MVNLSRVFKVGQEQQEVNKIRALFFRKKSSAKGKLVEETISNFLEDFNLTNGSKVTFKNFFDIYNDKSTKNLEENIAICKAFLDFIQTHGMEISFEGKTYVLKYSIIGEINYILDNKKGSKISKIEIDIIKRLDEEIIMFIYKIRDFFSELIDNKEQDLTKAQISLSESFFPKVSTSTREEVKDETEKHPPQNNLKISEILTIDLNWSDGELIDQISSFHNSQMIEFLNYIYDKIPSNFKIGKSKNVAIGRYLFYDQYTPNLGQSILKVLENLGSIKKITIQKFSLERIRFCLSSYKGDKIVNCEEKNRKAIEILEKKNNFLKVKTLFNIDLDSSDEEIKNQIYKFNSSKMVEFLDYIFDRIPLLDESKLKHIAIARYVFNDKFSGNLGQAISKVLKRMGNITAFIIDQFDLKRIRECLILSKRKIEDDSSENGIITRENGAINEGTDTGGDLKLINNGEKLLISELIELDLSSDDALILSLTDLSREDAGVFWEYLEKLFIDKYKFSDEWLLWKIAGKIHISEEKDINIVKKMEGRKFSLSRINKRFLENNINIGVLREILLEKETANDNSLIKGYNRRSSSYSNG